jgi:DNA repair protein RadC
MARKKVTENRAESNMPRIFARGSRFTSDEDFVPRYITPILKNTPDRARFLIVFLDRENHVISHQTLAICLPPKRRIDLKRCLSLARKPAGAVHCVFAHNHPGVRDPEWSEQDLETVRLLHGLAWERGLDLVDCILWGTAYYKSAYKAGYFCRGWDFREVYAAGRGRNA